MKILRGELTGKWMLNSSGKAPSACTALTAPIAIAAKTTVSARKDPHGRSCDSGFVNFTIMNPLSCPANQR